MLTALLVGALSAAALVQQTDTIVQANGASSLEVESFQGEVVVRIWNRDAVQVRADHSSSTGIRIDRSGDAITVEPDMEGARDLAHAIDFEITVPERFDVSIEGVALTVDVRGVGGQVEVTTVHGPITVHGGRESITLESVNGHVHLQDAQGDIEVIGVAGGVTIVDCSGDVSAQSVGGSLTLEGIRSADVEVGTVGGTLRYEGGIEDGGSYSFGSHGGEIWLHLPPGINAEVEVMSLAGEVEIDYPGAPTEAAAREGIPGWRGKEFSFELGNGSAHIEVETFGGIVHILRQGG